MTDYIDKKERAPQNKESKYVLIRSSIHSFIHSRGLCVCMYLYSSNPFMSSSSPLYTASWRAKVDVCNVVIGSYLIFLNAGAVGLEVVSFFLMLEL